MDIVIVGGIERLSANYGREVEKLGHSCTHYNGYCTQLHGRLRNADAMILFTSTISHQAADLARSQSRQYRIPLLYATGSGVSALRRCLGYLSGHDGSSGFHTGGPPIRR
jgi:uncharacterized protein DUF2325